LQDRRVKFFPANSAFMLRFDLRKSHNLTDWLVPPSTASVESVMFG
jgi:hypothetical protein